MRGLLPTALLGLLLVTACASGRSQASQDHDGRVLAGALRAADVEGASFKLDQQLVLTGGSIPAGQEASIHATVNDGVLRDGSARFSYRITQGSQSATYDMLIKSERLYVKHPGSSAWKVTPLPGTTALFPSLRLDLVRETVLLASSVGAPSLTHVPAGFAQRYVVRPAADQVEEMESVAVQGSAEDQFLKTATAELDVFLLVPSGHLGRVEVHLTGTDPGSGETQNIQSGMDVQLAKVSPIQAPSSATVVDPGQILS